MKSENSLDVDQLPDPVEQADKANASLIEASMRNHKLASALLCLNYPQFKIEDAVKMPIGDKLLYLKAARFNKLNENIFFSIVQLTATSKPNELKKIIKNLEKEVTKLEKSF